MQINGINLLRAKKKSDRGDSVQTISTSITDIKAQLERLSIKLGIKLGDYHSVNLESNKKSILLLVIFYPRITRTGIAKVLNITVSTLDYHLRWLRKEKLLERVGADKNGYWKINL